MMDRILNWIIGILAAVVLVGLIFVVTTSAHAAPTYAGDITVADGRRWSDEQLTAFVIGFNSYSQLMGIHCTPAKSMGEYVAAIRHNSVAFTSTDKLADALFAYMVDSGCRVGRTKKNGA